MGDLVDIFRASAERAPWGWALLSAFLLALYRGWPALKKLASEERAGDFKRLREDIADIRAEAIAAKAAASRLENMVACMRPAISILISEVKRLDPDHPNNAAVAEARELMAMAAAGDMGINRALVGLASVPATDVKE